LLPFTDDAVDDGNAQMAVVPQRRSETTPLRAIWFVCDAMLGNDDMIDPTPRDAIGSRRYSRASGACEIHGVLQSGECLAASDCARQRSFGFLSAGLESGGLDAKIPFALAS
jgi:hypothetical protein